LKSKIYRKSSSPIIQKEEVKFDTLVFGPTEEKLDFTYSKCCTPIPGDQVFGFTTIREGIKIHRHDCPNAVRLQSNFAYRILKAKWIDSTNTESIALLNIKGIDRVGLVTEVTQILSNNLKINIQSSNISSVDGVFDGLITVVIHDKNSLTSVIETLKKAEGISSVKRKFKSR